MTHFVKLYSSILDSTIWAEPAPTVKVWLTLLAMADPNGFVDGAMLGVMRRAIVSREECETAIRVLESPDPDSKTPDHEGRRIERKDGGWQILNHRKYRDLRTDTQIATAARVRKHRGETSGSGYVYYAKDGERVKIGFSKNPSSRVAELKCAIPSLELIGMEEGTLDLEHHRHKQFADSKINREWFTLSANLKQHITLLKVVTVTNVTRGSRSNGAKPEVRAEVEVEVDKEKTTTPRVATGWVGRFLTAYLTATQGTYSPGRLGRELKEVIHDHGENPAFVAWTAFLRSADRKYGPPYFAKNYVDYSEGKRNGHPSQEEQHRRRGIIA